MRSICAYNVKQQGGHRGFQNDAAFHRRLHHLRSGDVIGIQGSWGEGLGLQRKGTEKKSGLCMVRAKKCKHSAEIYPSFLLFFFKPNHLILRGQNEMLNDGLGKACFSNSLFTSLSLSLSLQRHWFTEL